MFNNNSIIHKGESIISTDFNFDIKKLDYIPLLNTPNNLPQAGFMEYSLSAEEGTPIKALEEFNNPYSFSSIGSYLEVRRKYLNFVSDLSNLKVYIKNIHLEEASVSEYSTVSYDRLVKGKIQVVKGVYYLFSKRTIGIAADEINGYKVVYLLTLKTKYLESLQKALIAGTPFSNTWFKLFVDPTVEAFNTKTGKFKAPFYQNFIAPYEEKSIEIEYKENFIADIVLPIEEEYEFTSFTGTRAAIKTKKEDLFAEFLTVGKERAQTQADWDEGKRSQPIMDNAIYDWLRNLSDKLLFDRVEEEFYASVTLEDGMVRKVVTEDSTTQYYDLDEGKWVTRTRRMARGLTSNSLIVVFSLGDFVNLTIEEKEENTFDIQGRLEGYIFPYEEGINCIYYESSYTYHHISGFKAEKKEFLLETPTSLLYLPTNITYQYDVSTLTYNSENGIFYIPYEQVNGIFNEILVTTSLRYKTDFSFLGKSNWKLIYFIDEDVFYLRTTPSILMGIKRVIGMDYTMLVGEPLLVEIVRTKLLAEGNFKLGQGELLTSWLYRPPTVEEAEEVQEVQFVDEPF